MLWAWNGLPLIYIFQCMLERTDAMTNEVLEPITFFLAYPTVCTFYVLITKAGRRQFYFIKLCPICHSTNVKFFITCAVENRGLRNPGRNSSPNCLFVTNEAYRNSQTVVIILIRKFLNVSDYIQKWK
jgi:hypothetical protein